MEAKVVGIAGLGGIHDRFYLSGYVTLKRLPGYVNLKSLLGYLRNLLENLRNLREIDLEGCMSLEDLPNSIEKLTNLQNIDLEVLPNAIGALMNLQEIDLSGCVNLKRLPNFSENLSNVHTITLSNCISLEALPDSIENLLLLRHLHLRCCSRLIVSNETLGNITTLECLNLSGMNGLREMHLHLTEISEVSFPAGVCPNLRRLKISWCNDLVEVGALPTTLKHLDLKGCCALTKVGGLDIRGCCALEVEELAGPETVISMDTLRPILISLEILKTPLEPYDPDEEEEEQMRPRRWIAVFYQMIVFVGGSIEVHHKRGFHLCKLWH